MGGLRGRQILNHCAIPAPLNAAGFDLHKWHSNALKLEANTHLKIEGQTYAKEQLAVKPNEAKLLGLPWHKEEDTLPVVLSRDSEEATKRRVLRSLASVYDPLGVAGPVTLKGKMIFREACDQQRPSDAVLPEKLRNSGRSSRTTSLVRLKFPAV